MLEFISHHFCCLKEKKEQLLPLDGKACMEISGLLWPDAYYRPTGCRTSSFVGPLSQ